MTVYTVEITIEDNETTKGFEVTDDLLKTAMLTYHDLLHKDDIKINIINVDSY